MGHGIDMDAILTCTIRPNPPWPSTCLHGNVTTQLQCPACRTVCPVNVTETSEGRPGLQARSIPGVWSTKAVHCKPQDSKDLLTISYCHHWTPPQVQCPSQVRSEPSPIHSGARVLPNCNVPCNCGAQQVNQFPRSQSDQAFVGDPGTSLILGGHTSQLTGIKGSRGNAKVPS